MARRGPSIVAPLAAVLACGGAWRAELDDACGAAPGSKRIDSTNKRGKGGDAGDVGSASGDDFFATALPGVDAGDVPPAG